ncbi:Imidazole glycerol phosphate synthase subunit HisF [Quillaja saponaria]|uniref:Imidazole glycerol phosphate synthase subunit HisF n=1 Tax=Quillaja saponaria TaxID=32244 RepID=A0AAD7VDG0_QUISA|nr:Imidazole glycerol phosphate synthase subunit HisF [Quillaja saponaria]
MPPRSSKPAVPTRVSRSDIPKSLSRREFVSPILPSSPRRESISPILPLSSRRESVSPILPSPSTSHIISPSPVTPAESPSLASHDIDSAYPRPIISTEPGTNPRRFHPSTITHEIGSDIISHMPGPIATYKSYPQDVKDSFFDSFMRRFRFVSEYDKSMACIVWEKTAQERFNQLLHNARNMARVKSRSQNPLDWRRFGPAAI